MDNAPSVPGINPGPPISLSERPLREKLVDELRLIAGAMGLKLPPNTKKDKMRDAINRALVNDDGIANDPQWLPLLAHRSAPKAGGKTSAGKALEEQVEASRPPQAPTGANKTLLAQNLKTDPPGQFTRLALSGPQAKAVNISNSENGSDSSEGENIGVSPPRTPELGLHRFHSGWSNFADWVNDCTSSERKFTYRQSQRLWTEHFSRRLLVFHNKIHTFLCSAHPNTRVLSDAVRTTIGVDGGVLATAMTHGCVECTHVKRFRSDLVAEGAVFGRDYELAEMDNGIEAPPPDIGDDPAAVQLPLPQQLNAPPPGLPRGYVRLAVMDGKNIQHRKCALDLCQRPLLNYRDGRFCEVHLDLRDICGIIPCGRPVREAGAVTCNDQAHMDWYRQYHNRFSRLSFPGVRRVIRRQQERGDNSTAPALRVELPALGDLPGDQVVHTFKAGSTYCLQTIQWACGYPIGWGKCYRSESESQVLGIMDRIWADHPDSRPSFLAYDNACSLLRHIVTQDSRSP
ncbi:hypothetical protein MVEN_01698600 [Mycena venus]|uniref:CxC6 like cysteine cluster associated with KDZ domain-containing protein n=1 Tax=Mycena venus TaxID=2733690 RepID=A0A8H6XPG8_9AGAR|nr:hypothetical protein MVEN_01698600 [Mycena venus]